MSKINNILIAFLLVAVVILGGAVAVLYQRDSAGTETSAEETNQSGAAAAGSESGDEAQSAAENGNASSGEAELGKELRCSVQLGALKIVAGEKFGVLEGNADDCQTALEDGVYTISSNTTHSEPIVVSVPEGIRLERAVFTVSGGTLTVENLDVQDLEATCEQGALQFSGRVEGNAEVEHLQGETALQLEGSPSDFNYEISYELGHVQIGEQSYAGAKGSQSIDNHSENTIRVHCAMGSVGIVFPEAA